MLVIDPVGQLSRVAVGDRVGKNFGEVTELNRDGFVVLEKLEDGQGRWYSHLRKILKDGEI
jgi:Tfp pilus assembly protein PilP